MTETEHLQRRIEHLQHDCQEAIELLAKVVAQANVNPVNGDDGFIARYDMPVGSIHRIIPWLAQRGIHVDEFGAIHRRSPIVPH